MESPSKSCSKSETKIAKSNLEQAEDADAARSTTEELDTELDELLDESLADLTTYTKPSSTNPNEETKPTASVPFEGAAGPPSGDDDFVRALLGGAMGDGGAAELEEHLKTLLQDDPLVMAEFEKLTQSQTGPPQSAGAQKAFADTLAETLTSLSANAETLKSELNEDELMKSFQQSLNLGADGKGEGSGDFIPMMQNMMSNLLSKDVLYPSLKDLADKYPNWLSTNNGKVPKKQFDLYTKQFDIVSKLCDYYNSEKDTDTQEIKDERFEQILDLMTQMQECGPPPKEIVGELAPGLNFDADGNPQLPGMEQCSIM